MQKQFSDRLRSLDGLNKRILVAVSGGLDSVVLLHLLAETDNHLAIVHGNFQLRGDESDQDESFVRKMSTELVIPFYTRRFDTNNYAIERGLSIQMAARQLRYDWFETLLSEERYDWVATAHHLNDNLETFLLHVTRGTGLQGLQGIPEKNGHIIRPLLTFTRQELESYASECGLVWREDSSNAHDDYQRNLIRHQVIPRLKELNPSLEGTFKRSLERIQAAGELTHQSLERLKEVHVQRLSNQVRISKTFLHTYKYPAPVLLEFIQEFGFNLDQCHEIVLASTGQSGKIFLTPTQQLVVDRDHLIVSPRFSERNEVYIAEGQELAVLGSQVLSIQAKISAEIMASREEASLDDDKLLFPLIWRKWRPGDSFVPLGMERRKKLSDFLIDNKVSLPDKEEVTVLESGGEIAWVVGYRIDNRFKVVESTKRVLLCKLKV